MQSGPATRPCRVSFQRSLTTSFETLEFLSSSIICRSAVKMPQELHFLGPFDASGRSTALQGLVDPVLDRLLLLNVWLDGWRVQIQGTCYGGLHTPSWNAILACEKSCSGMISKKETRISTWPYQCISTSRNLQDLPRNA